VSRLNFDSLNKPPVFGSKIAGGPDLVRSRVGFLARTSKRRLASLAAAADVLTCIPVAGETLHAIMTGYYDLMHLLILLLEKAGSSCQRLRIATLSLSRQNVQEMATLLDAGKVERLDLLCNGFFQRNNMDVFAELLLEFSKRGQKVAAAPSHCKIVAVALADGRRFLLEGSANLRTNRSQEQFALTCDSALHDWYALWLDEMVAKHEVRPGNDSEAG